MRNLKLLECLRVTGQEKLAGSQAVAVDYDSKVVYCATNKGICALDPQGQQVILELDLARDGYLPSDNSVRIVGLQHLPDQFSVCVALSSGDLLLCNTTNSEVECVGSVESGLSAMSWSPDMELLVLATGQGTLIMMTRDFDPLLETAMQPGEFGEAEPVTVGWGRKETQFHGSVGKQAAKQKSEDLRPASEWDDHRTRISWRGDGQYFVVSSISADTGARRLRVWTREGALHTTSELVTGVESGLSWKPSGSLIATSLRRPNKHEVVFYELNGLRHGQFALTFDPEEVIVKELLWNNDSTVLAVWCEELNCKKEPEFKPRTYLQMWTMGNYHWYLKQAMEFRAGQHISAVCWDPEHAYQLHVVCGEGDYLRYTWCWATSHSFCGSAQDLTTVAVVDGSKALMTPFRKMVVPPPMCAFQVQVPANISDIAFSPLDNSFGILYGECKLAVYTFNSENRAKPGQDDSLKLMAAGGEGFGVMCPTPTLVGTFVIKAPSDKFPLMFSHMTFIGARTLLLCTPGNHGDSTVMHLVELLLDSQELHIQDSIDIPGSVVSIAHSVKDKISVIQLTDGTLLRYDTTSGMAMPWEDSGGSEIKLPQKCPHMTLTHLDGDLVAVGLTDTYRLYVNTTEVANNCTSFAIHDEFILLTTHSHTLRCIHRSTPVKRLPLLTENKDHPFDESIRRVERGSKAVSVVPDDTKFVLQMPRGNLETIHPRALVLSAVRKNLDALHFSAAFEIMRKHRINMNLIYDHNPQIFLENVLEFIKQITQVSHISLFLTDLQEENVTKTMYTGAYSHGNTSVTIATTSKGIDAIATENRAKTKVDTICDAMLDGLESADSDKYMLCILTAYVRKSTPQLDTALQRVRDLKSREKDGFTRSVKAEEALKYLLFLVDVNELYDVSLGTYDFDLVMMVAQKSQKDPKEYLPFLNNLRKMEANYQRYTIDLHLKRHSKALEHISKCGNEHFSECLNLIKQRELFSEALMLYTVNSQQYRDIAVAYGEHLTEKKRPEEAGIVFTKADETELALEAFELALNWRQVMIMATKLQYAPDKMEALSRKMAKTLKEKRRHAEAAVLLEHYAQDVEECIVGLIEGGLWEESLRVMYKHGRTDFIESNLKSAVLDSCSHHNELLDETQASFERYRARLAVVRETKERERLEWMEGGGNHNDADADLFSDTSSATGDSVISAGNQSRTSSSSQRSDYSKSSGTSRKSRRKTERKKWSLREGSTYEDIALIEALSKIYKQSEEWREELHSLLKTLVLFHHEKEAKCLQTKFDGFLKLLTSSVSEIWDPEAERDTMAPPMGPDTTANVIAMAMRQGARGRQEVVIDPQLKIPPVVRADQTWKIHLV